MRSASSNKNPAIFILPLSFLVIIYLVLQQGITKGAEIFLGVGILTMVLLNYQFTVVLFFILGLFFRSFFNINFLGIPVLDPYNVISLILFYHFLSKGLLLKKGLLGRKYIGILSLCFLGNFIFCFRYWIFQDFHIGPVSSYLLSFVIIPIQTIFILSQIFKNIKSDSEIEKLSKLIAFLSIFCFFYLLEVYFGLNIPVLTGENDSIWSNKLLGHKNTYGPFFVILFFMFLHLYNFTKWKNKNIYLAATIASLGVVTISLSRNAYLALILVSLFLFGKGILVNKRIFIALLFGGLVVAFISTDIIINRVTSIINPFIGGSVEQFHEASSGHFTKEAFEEIGHWLVENPLFGGFFESRNILESGWSELIQKQGLIGLFLYIFFLRQLHLYIYPKLFSKNDFIKKYSVIGYSILLAVYLMNITDFLIYTYSNTPLYFVLTFIYLSIRWHEKNEYRINTKAIKTS